MQHHSKKMQHPTSNLLFIHHRDQTNKLKHLIAYFVPISCFLALLLLQSSSSANFLPHNSLNAGSISPLRVVYSQHHHHRLKRQVNSAQASNNAGSNQAPNAGGSSDSSSASRPSNEGSGGGAQYDASNPDDKPPEEVLSNLKCDFGSADTPDLCKFKILENDNPLTKGLATWTLGSGKLALFQGGPMIDASQGNDSFGGYIFYETSNPYVMGQSMAGSQAANNYSANHHYGMENLGNDYSTVLTSAFASRHHYQSHSSNNPGPNRQESNTMDQSTSQAAAFQQVSSPRVSIGYNSPGPAFLSPNLTAPGPSGMCLSFHYAIQGLSAEELRIYVIDHKTSRSRPIWASSESAASNWTRGEVLYSVTNQHSLMFSAASGPSAVVKDSQQRKFRGYLALDEIEINKHDPLAGEGPCKGHCNFDGDLCGWTNAENGQEDNFDWSFGRGSDNLFTGPARDFTSSGNNEMTGSYLFTDSGYPRRPGDRAVLVSPMFQPTAVNEAMCMRLAVHMFGSGIGSLAIKIRYADESVLGPAPAAGPAQDSSGAAGKPVSFNGQPSFAGASARSGVETKSNELVIWEMSGDAGNSWHQAQTSVSSSKSPFQVLIEGVIGENHLGNMAIDEISFSSGPCPTSPPVASKNYGDCTFEQSMCYWRNPDADIHLDDLDWIRTADEQSIHGPNFDHTLKRRSGSYLKLENTLREPKSGSRAFLLSPIFQPKATGSVQCLSFYYYMFMRSISSSGPNLGTIRVYLASNNDLVPIWRLTNPISSPSWKHGRASLSASMIDGQPQAPTKLFQIAFEGIWGDAASGAIALDDITVFDGACDIMPAEAKSVPGECTFDVDLCMWSNKTYDVPLPMDGQPADPSDNSRSPFLQSVNSATGGNFHQASNRLMMNGGVPSGSAAGGPSNKRPMGWQLATVDARPVNLQDHTYKAPIGYTFVDVLDGGSQPMAYPLQSLEVANPGGQQVALCLSFWFAAFGRQDSNQLQVYLTQASAPPQPPDDGGGPSSSGAPAAPRQGQSSGGSPAGGNQANSNNLNPPNTASSGATATDDGENANAWKSINGKLLWSVSLRNITEANRRKWLYGQVTLKADSNYIVRFVAISNDGGFALDDVSYFDGVCQTRPAHARIQSAEDEAAELQAAQQLPPPPPAAPGKPTN
uniref:Apical endosomal glycoprotein n=1 Tax=Aceria tosichella TaxID=561515 RepID=A0A6G1SID0_9ACAR